MRTVKRGEEKELLEGEKRICLKSVATLGITVIKASQKFKESQNIQEVNHF